MVVVDRVDASRPKALISLRFGVHAVLGAIGAEANTPVDHVALAVLMAVGTVALVWFDQRVTFRTLGLGRAAVPVAAV